MSEAQSRERQADLLVELQQFVDIIHIDIDIGEDVITVLEKFAHVDELLNRLRGACSLSDADIAAAKNRTKDPIGFGDR
jgi:hypothetical protein